MLKAFHCADRLCVPDRDARLEARRAKGAKIHGASRAAEDSRDGLDLPETVTFGSDTRSDLNRQ